MSRIKNVLEYLEESAEKFPQKIAFADEEKSVTYSQLQNNAKRMAAGILKMTAPHQPVAVLGEKSVDTVTAFLACVYAGCFYVPLNPLHPGTRREAIWEKMGFPLLLVQEKCRALIPTGAEETQIAMIEKLTDGTQKTDEILLQSVRCGHVDTDPLYVMFTSGSTGTPKGIAVSHRSVIDFIEEFTTLFGIGSQEVIGNQAPFDFDVSVKDIYSTLKAGATMQIIQKKLFSFPSMLIDYLIEREVTVLIWAVSALCILSTLNAFDYKVPERIGKVLFSGEAMPVKQLNVWKKHLPEAMFVNLYGPTEITCNCTYYILEKGLYREEILPIGNAFPNERVFLLNESGNAVTEPHETGEICVSGTALSLGYYNDAAATERAFIQNPLNKSYLEPVYRTGDLAYYDGKGRLCFVGRKDFQIKHQGHRIELSEIESVMLTIPGLNRAVCMYNRLTDKIYGFYQGEAASADIRVYLRGKLPSYMVPHKCVPVENFILNENGKIDRKKLQEKYF